MTDWKETYLSALEARDEVEKADIVIYEAYTRLADRTASQLAQTKAQPPPDVPSGITKPPPPIISTSTRRPPPPIATPSPSTDPSLLTTLRTDLLSAQSSRHTLATQLSNLTTEISTLRTQSKSSSKRIAHLTANVTALATRLRDRDEELRGKAKLVEAVQDENVTLTLQLNMADEQTKKLTRENQELVDRWMARIGKEAERMNDESKFK